MESATKIFLNLPVAELKKSMEFFGKLGFSFEPRFTDEHAACMIVGGSIYVMLLTRPTFVGFTKKELVDTSRAAEAIVSLSAPSRARADELADAALAAGARPANAPTDYGYMYGRSFQDLDGHIWEIFYLDEAAMEKTLKGA